MSIGDIYVNKHTANLLKKAGFNFPVNGYYTNASDEQNAKVVLDDDPSDFNNHDVEYNKKNNTVSAPTHEVAMKWFREKKNIIIWIEPYVTGGDIHLDMNSEIIPNRYVGHAWYNRKFNSFSAGSGYEDVMDTIISSASILARDIDKKQSNQQ